MDSPLLPRGPGSPGVPGASGGPGAPLPPPPPNGVSNIRSCMLSIRPCRLLRTEGSADGIYAGAGMCVCVTVVPPAHKACVSKLNVCCDPNLKRGIAPSEPQLCLHSRYVN